MNNNNKYRLKFTRIQRSGIFVLLLLIVAIQFLIYLIQRPSSKITIDPVAEQWLLQQSKIDSLKIVAREAKEKIQPFNPNFISDYKGYVLGMTLEEIDRLHAFRKENKYVNSAAEFQKVTQMPDEKLGKIAPYFKFPDWINNREKSKNVITFNHKDQESRKNFIIDINLATKEELMKIYGIGSALSERILKEKEKFGAFVSTEQFQYIWGLSEEVVEQLVKHFPVLSQPEIKKIDINNTSLKELVQFPYFRFSVAKQIVTYRSMNGGIKSKEDLTKIKEFPVEKVDIIALYLDF